MEQNMLDCARMGDLDFFKGIASDVLLNSITEGSADSVLDIVAKENHLGCCEEICKKCPSLLYRLNYNGDTPLHHAAWHGDPKMVKFFISADTKMDFKNEEDIENQGGEIVPNKKLLMMKNRQGNTALHHAVKKRHHEAAMIMIEADPDNKLLIMSNNNNQTALDLAVESKYFRILRIVFGKVPYMANDLKKKAFNLIATCDNLAMVELLIEADPDKKLLRMVDDSNKDSALHWAVRYQNIEILSMLIKADPDKMLVRVVNEDKDTALHLAVRLASVGAVKLLIEADPDLEYCPNNSGETPLLIAVNEDMTASATFHMLSEIRKLLLKAQPSQCKARIDDRGWTLLHLATRKGNLRAIDDIIQISPDCVHLVDIEGQNFLHFAAKYELVKVMMHVLGSKEIPDSVLNGKDKKGNTPLHTAALNGTESVVLCLLYYPKVDKTTVNGKGQHVLDAINFGYDHAKAGVYGPRGRMGEKELKDQTDFDLVVGALIATVSFTAGITVPGGYISDGGPNQGRAVLSNEIAFKAFVISNTFALLLSLYAVFSHFCARRLDNKEHIVSQLNVAALCTFGAIFAMIVAFISGSYSVLANSDGLAITVCVICSCFFIFAFQAVLRMGLKPWRAAP